MNTRLLRFIVLGVLLTLGDASSPRSQLGESLLSDFATAIFLVGVYGSNRRGYTTDPDGVLTSAVIMITLYVTVGALSSRVYRA